MDMEIPVIDLSGLNDDDATERSQTLARLHQACKTGASSGYVGNHDVDGALMEEVKSFVYCHYDDNLKDKFYASDLAKILNWNVCGNGDKDNNVLILDTSQIQSQTWCA